MAIRQTLPESRQSDLLGGMASVEIHRLFFALMPDDATRMRLAEAAAELRARRPELRARWIQPARFHATLRFLGEHAALRPSLVDAALAAGDRICASAFEWMLDHADSFRGREPPCILRAGEIPEPMHRLWEDLGRAWMTAGQPPVRETPFTPHVTLAYGQHALPQSVAIEPIAWRVAEFMLVHSVAGQSRYRILGRWSLDD